MEIPQHLTCLLRNLYVSQEATVRTAHGTTDWLKIGKEVHEGCILSPCLFIFYAQYIMRNARLMKHKLESRLPGEIQPQICRWHHPYGRKQRGTSEPLDESERGEWKGWLKMQHSKYKDHGIQSHHFMANRWGNKGNSDRLFSWTKKSLRMVTAAMKLKDACCLEEKLWQI